MADNSKRTSRRVGSGEGSRTEKRSLPIGLLIVGIGAVIVLLLVVVLAIANQPRTADGSEYLDRYAAYPQSWIDRRSLGNPNAAVVVQAWEDFRCPACAQWNQQIKPRLIEDFVAQENAAEGGSVRLEFRHFPLSIHEPGASLAAQASECAADQGTFWPYHDRLFAATSEGPSGFTVDRLQQYADELELDSREFSTCLSSQPHFEQVRGSVAQALETGLNSTPSVLINGELVEEPFNYQALAEDIRARLEAATE